MDFIFYKNSGLLHDVQETFVEDQSIDPATGEIYDNGIMDNFYVYDIDNVIENPQLLKYLALEYPHDLIKALRE